MSHNSTDPPSDDTIQLALKNIHLTINSGETTAICGRTGSGKSSLVALLLKLLDPLPETTGRATIDKTPLGRINRSALRQRIIAVPQEAVFMPDGVSFKTNLDPELNSLSEDCEDALKAVGLWKFVEERGGLDAAMSAGTLSAGQRQLFSVGRAVLRRRIRSRKLGDVPDKGILILDEISSSVDVETERVIMELIKAEFRNYTVVAVSHRLEKIMEFDKVVVMDCGEIVEMGRPVELATKMGSRFGDLVRAERKEAGREEA